MLILPLPVLLPHALLSPMISSSISITSSNTNPHQKKTPLPENTLPTGSA